MHQHTNLQDGAFTSFRIPKQQLPTSKWLGGETTQLAIFPYQSSLQERNFDLRISTATVNADAPFTDFAGYERILIMLQGNGIALSIDDSTLLLNKPFSAVKFSGTSKTSSNLIDGPIADFNIIYKPNAYFEVALIGNNRKTEIIHSTLQNADRSAANYKRVDLFYSNNSNFTVKFNSIEIAVETQDLLRLETNNSQTEIEMDLNSREPNLQIIYVSTLVLN